MKDASKATAASCSLETKALQALQVRDYARSAELTASAAESWFHLAETSKDARHAKAGSDLVKLADAICALAARGRHDTPTGIEPLAEFPDFDLNAVAGMVEAKMALAEMVLQPLSHPNLYARFRCKTGGGLLLYGAPGTGKTFLAKALAGTLRAPFFAPELSSIKSKYVGESAKNISRLFSAARQHPLSVVFLDECDALLAARTSHHSDIVASFLTAMDGINSAGGNILCIGASNAPWAISPAALRPGRLGCHIMVGLPDLNAREQMLINTLSSVPVDPSISISRLSEQFAGRTAAEITESIERAKLHAISRQIRLGSEQMITSADFHHALEVVQPQTSAAVLRRLEEFRQRTKLPESVEDED